jgi:hypothetical protein
MRNLASASIITATGVAVAAPSVGCPARDPIFAAIEAHRLANAEYIKANEPCADMVGKHCPVRVRVGYADSGEFSKSKPDERGGFILTYTPTGKMEPVYAYSHADIEKSVPSNLRGEDRNAWIVKHIAEFEKVEKCIAKQHARTKLGKLQAVADRAYDRERDRMRDLVWTKPTTIDGLAALLRYCRENESINELVCCDELEDVLEWTNGMRRLRPRWLAGTAHARFTGGIAGAVLNDLGTPLRLARMLPGQDGAAA